MLDTGTRTPLVSAALMLMLMLLAWTGCVAKTVDELDAGADDLSSADDPSDSNEDDSTDEDSTDEDATDEEDSTGAEAPEPPEHYFVNPGDG